jgi:hypothetical protein
MGKLLCWSTRANHVGFRTLDPNDAAGLRDGQLSEESRLTINGVPYRFRLDFHTTNYFGEDKTSSYKRPWYEWDGWGIAFGSVHLDRTDKQTAYGHGHTDGAMRKVLDVLAPELVEIIKTDQVQRIIVESDLLDAEHEVGNIEAEIRQLHANLELANQRRAEAKERVRKARSRVP